MARPRKHPRPRTYSARVAIRLAELIESAGLSIDEAAAAIGRAAKQDVPPERLRAWLRTDRKIPLELFPAIARAFGRESAADWLPSR